MMKVGWVKYEKLSSKEAIDLSYLSLPLACNLDLHEGPKGEGSRSEEPGRSIIGEGGREVVWR